MSDELVVVWPRDVLLPILDEEIKRLLRYVTRDSSWEGCFGIQVNAEGVVARLNKSRLWRNVVKGHSEITDDYVASLIAEVALKRGLAVTRRGIQMVIQERGGGETQNNHK